MFLHLWLHLSDFSLNIFASCFFILSSNLHLLIEMFSLCFLGNNWCVIVVWLLSHFWLCDPMNCVTSGFPVLYCLLEFAQAHVHWISDAIQPSHHLFTPSSSCPQSFLASGSFPMSWLFASGGQNIGASASASVLPTNIQGWLPLGLTLCAKLLQLCPTLCDLIDCSLPGSSVHGDSPGKNTRVGCHALPSGDRPNPGTETKSAALQADSLSSEPPGKLIM